MAKSLVAKTEEFVKKSFQKNPHFSYHDWRVMYGHSVKVKKIALQIAKTVKSDKTLVSLGALLHDIGKTKRASQEELHHNHEEYNLERSRPLLNTLRLDKKRLQKLENIISYKSRSVEQKIIKDADTLALYTDKKLHTLFLKWAVKEKLIKSIHRKINKYNKLNFSVSRKIGASWYKQMKHNWQKQLKIKF